MNDQLFDIGPYKVLKSIGKGGMGEVFLAFDPVCQRHVAIKLMLADKEIDEKKRQRFLNEAIVTGQLTHPGIIPIYSVVNEKELIYFVMPYIEGKMLKEIFRDAQKSELDQQPLDSINLVPSYIYMFLQICSAVSYAHSKGIIHRDLKSSNILVGTHAEIRILDWGLAEAIQEIEEKGHGEEGKGQISGTVIYMAPELVLGSPPLIFPKFIHLV